MGVMASEMMFWNTSGNRPSPATQKISPPMAKRSSQVASWSFSNFWLGIF